MAGLNLTQKILQKHLVEPRKAIKEIAPNTPIKIKIDQALTQDATGTLTYLEFISLGLKRPRTEVSVSYVDHNTLQVSFENADDHRFLKSVAEKYGIIFSPPGNGICHQLHLENFVVPGKTLIGSDSHTPTAGGAGMLAFGAGGMDVCLALAGQPLSLAMPEIVRVVLTGKLKNWASAKDVILEILRRLSVKGGVGKIFEYSGEGLKNLSVYERATISNMGTELGATSSIFPSDENTRNFLKFVRRPNDFVFLTADADAHYEETIRIELSEIEPLAACPHSPDNVRPVKELKDIAVNQVLIGSCTNSSVSDLLLISRLLKGKRIWAGVDLAISPGSRSVLELLIKTGAMTDIIRAGARVLENTCGPCIGIGQAPCSGGVSLRTFNRNFVGRSATRDASVYLVSPAVAVASALTGKITDPRKVFGPRMPKIILPKALPRNNLFIRQYNPDKDISFGPNIKPLPEFSAFPFGIVRTKVVLKLGDNISTDHILPGGARIMSLRSNIEAISEYTFSPVDKTFVNRARALKAANQAMAVIARQNYGQGSSREHAALVQRYLGVVIVIAETFARIHRANLINFGIVPLLFSQPGDYDRINPDDELVFPDIYLDIKSGKSETIGVKKNPLSLKFFLKLSPEEREIILAGGRLNWLKEKRL